MLHTTNAPRFQEPADPAELDWTNFDDTYIAEEVALPIQGTPLVVMFERVEIGIGGTLYGDPEVDAHALVTDRAGNVGWLRLPVHGLQASPYPGLMREVEIALGKWVEAKWPEIEAWAAEIMEARA